MAGATGVRVAAICGLSFWPSSSLPAAKGRRWHFTCLTCSSGKSVAGSTTSQHSVVNLRRRRSRAPVLDYRSGQVNAAPQWLAMVRSELASSAEVQRWCAWPAPASSSVLCRTRDTAVHHCRRGARRERTPAAVALRWLFACVAFLLLTACTPPAQPGRPELVVLLPPRSPAPLPDRRPLWRGARRDGDLQFRRLADTGRSSSPQAPTDVSAIRQCPPDAGGYRRRPHRAC